MRKSTTQKIQQAMEIIAENAPEKISEWRLVFYRYDNYKFQIVGLVNGNDGNGWAESYLIVGSKNLASQYAEKNGIKIYHKNR